MSLFVPDGDATEGVVQEAIDNVLAELEAKRIEISGDRPSPSVDDDASNDPTRQPIPITEKGLAVKEVVANEDAAHVIGVVATEEGWAAGEAVVTEEGVAARRVISTDEAVAGKGLVVTEEGAVAAGFVATEEGGVAGAAVLTPEEEDEDSED